MALRPPGGGVERPGPAHPLLIRGMVDCMITTQHPSLCRHGEDADAEGLCRWAVLFRLMRRCLAVQDELRRQEEEEWAILRSRIMAEKLLLWQDVAIQERGRHKRRRAGPNDDWPNRYLCLMLQAQCALNLLRQHSSAVTAGPTVE